jgi:hypothetical protein
VGNKEKYKMLCASESSIPIFNTFEWLESVAPDKWDVCLVEKNNQIVAAMPYVLNKIGFFKYITNPTLTQHLGPWIKPFPRNYNSEVSHQKKMLNALYGQLPKYHYLNQSWHYSLTNGLPCLWNGFDQTTFYTYVISDISDLDNVLRNFSSSYRNKLKKASKLVTAHLGLQPKDFFKINRKTFLRQGLEPPYSEEFFLRHDDNLASNQRREIFYARDVDGKIHSALYLTWDNQSAYVHMVGEDPDYRSSGSGIFLIYEAIKYTKATLNLNRFDFEGSMIEQVEKVRRDCGGKQVRYLNFTHIPNKWLRAVVSVIKVIRG